MIGLGIETSCDETSLSLVEDGKKLLGLKIFSQIALHKKFKGVVPEIASRAHLEKINLLFEELKEETFLKPESLSYVAVTSRPGLMGSLMIGAQFARCLSLVHSIPIITVDHLEAHLAAIYLENKEPLFPFLGVLLSGGNSSIYLVKNFGEMDLLGDTMDDALGEAFDKVSMILGLSYPGGPEIERRAGEYVPLNDEKRLFPELLKDLPVNKIQFSYSGIKTGVLYYSRKVSLKEREISKICYHFQNTAFQLVEKNIKRAVKKTGIRRVVAAGGVLANDTLKARLKKLAGKENIQISYPERKVLCTDNGAMVASLGYYLFQKQKIDKIDFKVSPNRQIYT